MERKLQHPAGENTAATQSTIEVSDLIVSYLENIGVEYVFGVPGGAIEPIYNALARSQRRGGPRPIVARHESGAAFMADGYARETGRTGVCVATSGPGATNLITGVACAYDNEIPLLVLTGQPPLPSFGKRALQESAFTGVNVLGMFQQCTRYNTLIAHPDQVETNLVNALLRAHQSPRGPVHLSIPVDIMRSPATESSAYDLGALLARAPVLIDHDSVQRLHQELRQAHHVVILVGGGCGHAIEAILELARITHALILSTPDGKGFINPECPGYRGVFGFAGHKSAGALLHSAPDLVLAFGTSLGEFNSGAWSTALLNSRLVHIDPCEEHFLRSPMARLQVRGPARQVCERLIALLSPPLSTAETDPASAVVPLFREVSVDDSQKMSSDAAPIKPQRLMRELSRRCPPNTCFLADAGNSMAWAVHYLELRDRRLRRSLPGIRNEASRRPSPSNGWLRVAMEFAPMGWAIGASIGIACATRGRPVVCITGDGSYLMNGQEITVAAEEQLPLLFIVLNDAALGMVKHGQRLAGAERVGFALPRVDFRMQAESLGIPGHVVRSPEDIESLDFEAILKRNGPTLLDVHIDAEEVPPMKLRMQTLDTSSPSGAPRSDP
jgi:acetolactate synthase-1/2/3 large subunit